MKNVFVLGAGADIDFFNEMPQGNVLLLEIFGYLEKTKEKIKNKDSIEHRLYYNMKTDKKQNNLFFQFNKYLKNMIKRCLNEKGEKLLIDSDDSHKPENINDMKISGSYLNLFFREDTKNKYQKFIASLLFNGTSAKIIQSNKYLADTLETKLKEKCISVDKSIFSEFELPLHYEPETIILNEIKSILIKNKKVKEDMTELEFKQWRTVKKLISELMDYSVVYDDVYQTLINYHLEENSNSILRNYHFMLSMYEYFSELERKAEHKESKENYYALMTKCTKEASFITLNYTNFIDKILGNDLQNKIIHLHGKTGEFFNLKDRVITDVGTKLKELKIDKNNKLIPNFIPQSLIKPIISIEMVERLYQAYQSLKKAKNIIIIGFGFNRDDIHIIEILNKAIIKNTIEKKTILNITDKSEMEENRIWEETKKLCHNNNVVTKILHYKNREEIKKEFANINYG